MLLVFFSSASFAEQSALPGLRVEGNRILTETGKPVALRGVSLCSLSWHNPFHLIRHVSDKNNGWKVSILRLPVQPEEWLRLGPNAYIKDRLDPAVEQCRKSGLYCIIDWHEIADWNDEYTERKLKTFWRIVAPRYADKPFILYEIFNEPKKPSERNRENWLAFRIKAQQWVDQIRQAAPETVLLIGSPHWSQMPSFAADDPLEGENLVYVAHVYGNWPQESWDDLFGNAASKIPLFISEWGWSSLLRNRTSPFYGTHNEYAKPLKAYLDERPHIGWTAWSYDPECGPAMLGKDKEMGDFVRQWLEEGGKANPPEERKG